MNEIHMYENMARGDKKDNRHLEVIHGCRHVCIYFLDGTSKEKLKESLFGIQCKKIKIGKQYYFEFITEIEMSLANVITW